MMNLEFKPAFIEQYRELLGDEVDAFLQKSLERLPNTIRVNTNKIDSATVLKRLRARGWKVEKLPFYSDGLKVLERDLPLGNTIEHFLGYYYVQEAASMLPPLVLDLEEGQSVWDVCASPGSKTTQISQMLNNKGLVIATDAKLSRVSILKSNCQRMACENVSLFVRDGARAKFESRFDRILVDAPCSAVGAIRKNYDIIQQWSTNTGRSLCGLQYNILRNAFRQLKSGGKLVYSTCTLEPLENEGVVNRLLNDFPDAHLLPIKIKNFKLRQGITSWRDEVFDSSLSKTARVYPQDNDTEGFFLSLLVKD